MKTVEPCPAALKSIAIHCDRQDEPAPKHKKEIKYLKINDQPIDPNGQADLKYDEHTVIGRVRDRRPTWLHPNPLPNHEIAEIIVEGQPSITGFVLKEAA